MWVLAFLISFVAYALLKESFDETGKYINQPSFATDRFDLRTMRRSDAGLVEFYTKDDRVARMTPYIRIHFRPVRQRQ